MWTARKLGWKASCLGLALCAATQVGRLDAAQQKKGDIETTSLEILASPAPLTVLDSLIDALRDGSLDEDEREEILSEARRTLSSSEVAQLEARLDGLPNTPSVAPRLGTVGLDTLEQDQTADDKEGGAYTPNDTKPASVEPKCNDWFHTGYFFGAADAWSGPIDDDNGNNFGTRLGFNMGVPLFECGVGAQLGMSYGAYNFHGRDVGETSAIEEQIFLTAGLFKRCNLCGPCPDRLSWAIVYDHLITDNVGEYGWEIGVGQVRGQIGCALDCANEVGIMGSMHVNDDEVDGISNNQDPVSALDQVSLFYHHKWCWGADSTWYVGVAEDPGEVVFGTRNEVALSPCWSLFGNAQYILPSTRGGSIRAGLTSADQFAEEFWNISVGAAYYPSGNAYSKTICGRRWMPLLPVADNGSFALEILPEKL